MLRTERRSAKKHRPEPVLYVDSDRKELSTCFGITYEDQNLESFSYLNSCAAILWYAPCRWSCLSGDVCSQECFKHVLFIRVEGWRPFGDNDEIHHGRPAITCV